MNPTLFVTALRQRFASRTRLVLVAAVFLFPIAFSVMAREAGLLGARTGAVFAFLIGAGILGQETSSGVFQLLFARPVRRWEYVVSRWLAVIASAGALVIAQILIIWMIVAAHAAASPREIGIQMAEQLLQVIGTSSVILFYSSILSGVGDVLGIVFTFIGAQILSAVGQFKQNEAMVRTGQEVLRFVNPQLAVGPMLLGNHLPWFEIVSYASTLALCVAVAIVILNRREISYASE